MLSPEISKRPSPGDERFQVVPGDCNLTVEEALKFVEDLRWAPAFAFIDPKGLEVEWTTLEHLSKWRRDSKGRKVELWILLPEPAFERVLGLKGVRGESSAERLTALFGSDGLKFKLTSGVAAKSSPLKRQGRSLSISIDGGSKKYWDIRPPTLFNSGRSMTSLYTQWYLQRMSRQAAKS